MINRPDNRIIFNIEFDIAINARQKRRLPSFTIPTRAIRTGDIANLISLKSRKSQTGVGNTCHPPQIVHIHRNSETVDAIDLDCRKWNLKRIMRTYTVTSGQSADLNSIEINNITFGCPRIVHIVGIKIQCGRFDPFQAVVYGKVNINSLSFPLNDVQVS